MTSLALILALASSSAPAVSAELTCPERITTDQTLTSTHEGWEPVKQEAGQGNGGRLIGFSRGKQASINKPAKTIRHSSGRYIESMTWTFGVGETDIYAVCEYRATSIHLLRSLPGGVRECTVRYNERGMAIAATCNRPA